MKEKKGGCEFNHKQGRTQPRKGREKMEGGQEGIHCPQGRH